ncbi:MAG TPA: hypothetical protein ACFYD3_03785 [Candidatus Hypogeohydataceae bacterium YC41]
MTLVRTFARIEDGGKLSLPTNIKKFAGVTDGDVVELKLVGSDGKILISKKELQKARMKKVAGH